MLVAVIVALVVVVVIAVGLTILHRVVDASYIERQLEEQLTEATGVEYEASVGSFEFSVWRGYVEASNMRFHPVANDTQDATLPQLWTVDVERVRLDGIKRLRLLRGNLTAESIQVEAPDVRVHWSGASGDESSEDDADSSPQLQVESFTLSRGNLLLESADGDSLSVHEIDLTVQHLDSNPDTTALRFIYTDDVALRVGSIRGNALDGDYILQASTLALSTSESSFSLHDFLFDASPEEPWLDAIRVNTLAGTHLEVHGIDFEHIVREEDVHIQTVNLHEGNIDFELIDGGDSGESGSVVTIDSLFITNSAVNLITRDGAEISADKIFGTAHDVNSSYDLAEYPLHARHVEVEGSNAQMFVGKVIITTGQIRGNTSTGNLIGDAVVIERPGYYTFGTRQLAAQGVDYGNLFAEGGFHVREADAYDLDAHVTLHPADEESSGEDASEQLTAQHLRVHSGRLAVTLPTNDQLRFRGLSGEMTRFDLRTEGDDDRVLWSTDVRAEVNRLEGTLSRSEQRLDVRNVRAATEAGTLEVGSLHLTSESLDVDSTGMRVDAGPIVLAGVDFPLFFHHTDIDVSSAEVTEPNVFLGMTEEEEMDLDIHVRIGQIGMTDGNVTVRIPSGDNQVAERVNGFVRGLDFGGDVPGRFLASEDIQITAEILRSTLQNGRLLLGGYNAILSVSDSTFSLEDAYFEPDGTDEEVIQQSRVRRDPARVQAPSVRLSGIDFERFNETQDIAIRLVEVDSAAIAIYIDRDMSPDPEADFPHQSASATEMVFQVDEIHVTNGRIEQREFAGGQSVGELLLSDVEIRAENISNDPEFMTSDTPLNVEVTAQLLEQALLEVQIAYPLHAQGFDLIYRGRVGTMDMEPLSEALRGLAGIEVVSGTIDSLAWDLQGRGNVIERTLDDSEQLRWAESEDSPPVLEGDLRFFYHDLEVRLVDSETGEQGLGNRILTFLANNLLVYSENESTGDAEDDAQNIVYEVEADDSFFDVLLNAILDGVLSEVLFIRI